MITQQQYKEGRKILIRYKATCTPQEIGLFAPEPKPRDASTAGEVITMNEIIIKINENKCKNIEVK